MKENITKSKIAVKGRQENKVVMRGIENNNEDGANEI